MKHVIKLLVILILFTSQAFAGPVEFTGFELGTRDDIQSASGTNYIWCTGNPTGVGTRNVSNLQPRTGRCMMKVDPTGVSTGSFRMGKVGPSGTVTTTIGTNDAYYRVSFMLEQAPASGSEEIGVVRDNAGSPVVKGGLRINSSRI